MNFNDINDIRISKNSLRLDEFIKKVDEEKIVLPYETPDDHDVSRFVSKAILFNDGFIVYGFENADGSITIENNEEITSLYLFCKNIFPYSDQTLVSSDVPVKFDDMPNNLKNRLNDTIVEFRKINHGSNIEKARIILRSCV